MIIAGPGSGKTRVMTQRIAHMVANGVYASSILAITFTNKAAAEMQARTMSLLEDQGLPYGAVPQISTFHSFCARLLRREIHHLEGYKSDFSIYDTADQKSLIEELIKARRLDKSSFSPASCQSAISKWKNEVKSPEDILEEAYDHTSRQLGNIYASYQTALVERNAVDFDDLLLLALKLLREVDSVRNSRRREHQYLLIDEFQDTNRPQYQIALILASEHRNICITGDPDQSIYSWRGADPTNFLDFDENFPECTVVELSRNYRSTPQILNVAQKMSGTLRGQRSFLPQCLDGEAVIVEQHHNEQLEARRIAELIALRNANGCEFTEMAVLYRVNALSRKLEEELVRTAIPYTIVGGTAFYQRKEIKDILGYLKAAANPQDSVALRRIINVPPRAVGSVTLERLEDLAAINHMTLGAAVRSEELCNSLPPRARKSIAGLREILLQVEAGISNASIGDLVSKIIELTQYEDYLKRTDPESSDDRCDNLDELCSAAAEAEELYKNFAEKGPDSPSVLQHFLERIALVSEADSWNERENRVVLMSMHAAKGLEFDHVFIPAMEEGLMPHERSLNEGNEEEEQRLLYVAITRAKLSVTLFHACMRRRFRDNEPKLPSSYLQQLECDDIEFRWLSDTYGESGIETIGESAAPKSPKINWHNEEEFADQSQANFDSQSTYDMSADEDFPCDYIPEDDEDFSVGIWLEHDTYGPGEVVSCTGVGDRKRVRVRFVESGERNFVAAHANFRILGDRPF